MLSWQSKVGKPISLLLKGGGRGNLASDEFVPAYFIPGAKDKDANMTLSEAEVPVFYNSGAPAGMRYSISKNAWNNVGGLTGFGESLFVNGNGDGKGGEGQGPGEGSDGAGGAPAHPVSAQPAVTEVKLRILYLEPRDYYDEPDKAPLKLCRHRDALQWPEAFDVEFETENALKAIMKRDAEKFLNASKVEAKAKAAAAGGPQTKDAKEAKSHIMS